jgi:hypothetical protein
MPPASTVHTELRNYTRDEAYVAGPPIASALGRDGWNGPGAENRPTWTIKGGARPLLNHVYGSMNASAKRPGRETPPEIWVAPG